MKTDIIETANDNPGVFVNLPSKEPIPVLMLLGYAESDNAAEIDRGIRETIRDIRISVLAMGVGLANMKAKGLYKDLGCKNLTEYIQRLSDETKMDRSNIFSWMRIGEAYIRNKSDLEQIGFTDSDGPTKLSYLNRALEKNDKQEVFDNIKNMSVREFKSFSKAQPVIESPAGRGWAVSVRGNRIYVNDKLMVILSKKNEPRAAAYFKTVLDVVCEALEKEGFIVPVFVRSRREVRLFEEALHRLKAEIGLR